MTVDQAIQEAIDCFKRVQAARATSYAEPDKATAMRMQALARVGEGYVELAKLLDKRKASE